MPPPPAGLRARAAAIVMHTHSHAPPPLAPPPAGLDARAAAIVMRTVRNTVNTGRTVVCTIHQPSLDIFQVWVGVRGGGLV